jgi:putative oxidoreductase
MDRNRVERLTSLGLRLVVAAVFLDAAVSKIWDPATFAESTGNYQLFPGISNYVAILLPSTELVAAFVLVFARKYWRDAATLVLLVMLGAFTVAIARAWALGINTECGCFGSGSSPVGPIPVLRNLGLSAAALLSFSLDRGLVGLPTARART